jgi:hypothetical protein
MHRTQIYLPEDLHDRLKARSRLDGTSISEIIRRALEKDIQRAPGAEARAYFERLKPLDSFAPETMSQSPEDYVRGLRAKSRLLRDE